MSLQTTEGEFVQCTCLDVHVCMNRRLRRWSLPPSVTPQAYIRSDFTRCLQGTEQMFPLPITTNRNMQTQPHTQSCSQAFTHLTSCVLTASCPSRVETLSRATRSLSRTWQNTPRQSTETWGRALLWVIVQKKLKVLSFTCTDTKILYVNLKTASIIYVQLAQRLSLAW